MAKQKKQKKEKIVWIDDGRSLADMSDVGGHRLLRQGTTSKPKDIWHTYWDAVKMMFKPMLVFIGALAFVYLLVYIIFLLMY